MLDGPPDPGTTPRHLASPGIEFRHSGRLDADTALVRLVTALPGHERLGTVVVTDDRSLTGRVRAAGGVPRRLDWLERLLVSAGSTTTARPGPTGIAPASPDDRSTAETTRGSGKHGRSSVGDVSRAPGRSAPDVPAQADEDEPTPWRPGRGATRKRGNPHRHRRG